MVVGINTQYVVGFSATTRWKREDMIMLSMTSLEKERENEQKRDREKI